MKPLPGDIANLRGGGSAPAVRLPLPWARALPVLVLLLAGVLWLYRDTGAAMVAIWSRSETFAHAFAVPPIVAWLVWRLRGTLATQAPRPSGWALLGLGGAGLLWLLGDLAATNAVEQLAFTALLVLAAIAVTGVPVARTLMFPLGFLFFAVPLGEFLLPTMMAATADFTVFALRLSGIPVYREGLQFVIPSGNWSVVEACSGIRYLIASFMVGVLFAYLNFRSMRRRLVFAGVALVVPIVANWVRAYLIVMLGHLSDNKLAAGVDHLIYGWLFFGVVMTVMFMIGARWAEAPLAAASAPALTPSPSDAAAPPRTAAWAVACGALLLIALPPLALHAIERNEDRVAPGGESAARRSPPRLELADALDGGWQRIASPAVDWRPAFDGATAELRQSYAAEDSEVGIFIGYYRQQGTGHKLVSSENVLVTRHDAQWASVASGERSVQMGATPLVLQTEELRGSSHPGAPARTRLTAWKTYWIDGVLTSSEARAKALAALHRLLGRGDDAAVIVVYTTTEEGAIGTTRHGGDAGNVLEAFLRANLHGIERQIGRARDDATTSSAEK